MTSEFWLSDIGLRIRLADFARLVTTRTYSRSLQAFAPEAGVKGFSYTTAGDEKVCLECRGYDDRTYRAGQFMPYLPRHPNCRCFMDIAVTSFGD